MTDNQSPVEPPLKLDVSETHWKTREILRLVPTAEAAPDGKTIVVVSKPSDWEMQDSHLTIISADTYIKDLKYQNSSHFRIFNLCHSYDYCSKGYYVSLLAEARGHRPLPNVSTLLDMKSRGIIKVLGEDLYEQIQKLLKPIRSKQFVLSVYFGKNLSPKYDGIARLLFNQFRTPFLRAKFEKKNGEWTLKHIRPISAREIPTNHRDFVKESMLSYFHVKSRKPKPKTYKYEIAVLYNEKEKLPPSNDRAIQKFIRAGEDLRMWVETIDAKDIGKLDTFDGLFIRETTDVGNHTFQFARQAEALGLVVIDDPGSILHCCNKVYLHELMSKNKLLTPKTYMLGKEALENFPPHLRFPLVIKKPDSAFSTGVKKIRSYEEFRSIAKSYFEDTDLLIVQDFVPTDFDWRVGVLNGEPLFVCRYYMAKNHWQIIHHKSGHESEIGKVESLPLDQVPTKLLDVAKKATSLIGDSLYGVDIKQNGDQFYVIEVNDNPNIDHGYEDKIIKDELYLKVMKTFLQRLEKR